MGYSSGVRTRILKDLLVVSTPLVGVLLVAFALGSKGARSNLGSGFDPLSIGFLSITVISILIYGLKRNGIRAARLVVAGVIFAGTISGLAMLNYLFEWSGSGLPVAFYLAVGPVGYLGLIGSYRSYTGTLSKKKTALLTGLSTMLLGALVGSLFPPVFTIILLATLTVFDALLIDGNLLSKVLGRQNFENFVSVTTLPLRDYLIGMGDLLVYAMLVATSVQVTGILGAIATIMLILTGTSLTFVLTRSRESFPGLPIPVWFGLIPTIVGVFIV